MEQRKYILRRLTPVECARLQGFPDWWCDGLETPEPSEQEIAFWTDVFKNYKRIVRPKETPVTQSRIVNWLRNPSSDSVQYMLWGNGIALPCACDVLGRIAEELRKDE